MSRWNIPMNRWNIPSDCKRLGLGRATTLPLLKTKYRCTYIFVGNQVFPYIIETFYPYRNIPA
jgi:hypothetical protein